MGVYVGCSMGGVLRPVNVCIHIVCIRVPARMSVCVCVFERERERERHKESEYQRGGALVLLGVESVSYVPYQKHGCSLNVSCLL